MAIRVTLKQLFALSMLKRMLSIGDTTVRDCGIPPETLDFLERNELIKVESGRIRLSDKKASFTIVGGL